MDISVNFELKSYIPLRDDTNMIFQMRDTNLQVWYLKTSENQYRANIFIC